MLIRVPIVYPAGLPCPATAGIQSVERRALSSSRPFQSRALERDRHAMQQITLPLMSATQAARFRAHWEDDLAFGGNWFASTWAVPWGPKGTVAVRRWIGSLRWDNIPGGYWRVSGTCEVRGVGELPYRTAAGPFSVWDPDSLTLGAGTITNGGQTFNSLDGTSTSARGLWGHAADDDIDVYFEITYNAGNNAAVIGVQTVAASNLYTGFDDQGFAYYGDGRKMNDSLLEPYGASYADGDVIGVRLNNGDLTFYKNGVSQGLAYGLPGSAAFFPAAGGASTTLDKHFTLNTGQDAFVALPSGSTAWG